MLRILLVFNLWVVASSQPIESIATDDGGSTLSAMLLNLGQALLEWYRWKFWAEPDPNDFLPPPPPLANSSLQHQM